MIALAMIAYQHFGNADQGGSTKSGYTAFLTIISIGIVVILFDTLLRNKQITTISAVYFGLLMGLLLGSIFSTIMDPFLFEWESSQKNADFASRIIVQRNLLRAFVTAICIYICISTLLQTKDEFRFIIPYIEFSKQVKGSKPFILDTSAIIDGRIADLCETRILDNRLIVPRFVLKELHALSDSADKLKRNRGRRGLDILKSLQTNTKVELQVHEGEPTEMKGITQVDEKLVILAKNIGGKVVTNDFNLNKIAQLQGVEVVNLNEVSNALKPIVLPGENFFIKIAKQGDQMGQGIGYLEDGTMVVVDQGRQHIGQDINVQVTSALQTPSGRMIFAKVDNQST
ncbi:MAG: PIN/TRAM domain-containing protein [Planctomycetota bacterium]|nr:PIN/TRAM domain-containing protein [Gemmataceae bacterium]MBJ7346669.1 PIN/TRAM domain-containing protein [Gemmataceae bacterium]MBJ7430462.1 PIN/TRAM domain-containing protein [Gemmataceae bacterium]MBJ7497293.1 PIN/TRAM domain-containing protein [Gemmataceae bacterium]RLS88662.1 MAG: PIN/TRAM domain-containing protein [Planctomycetota bacterium]